MRARNPHGQNLPAASHRGAEAVEMLDHRAWGQCGEGAQPPPQPKAPGSSMAFQHHQENQAGSTSRVSPPFSKSTSLPGQQTHPRLAAGREKFWGLVGPCPPWMVSILHSTAPEPGCASVWSGSTQQRGFCLAHFPGHSFFLAIFFSPLSLNVEKLNAGFEFLIRLSSFCHLFCFVMHYIQLHISNPQILPRCCSTCQAFPFHSRCIKILWRRADITGCPGITHSHDSPDMELSDPQGLPLKMPHPAQREGLQPCQCSQEPFPGLNPREGAPSILAKGARLSISETEITFCKSPTVNQLPSQI